MLRRTLLIALAFFSLGLSACGDSTGSDNSITGNYTLRTVNGVAVPATLFQQGADKLEVTGGNINLNRDNTFSGSLSVRITQSGTVATDSEPLSGTYTRNNNALVLTFSGGDQETATISGRDLTIAGEGLVLVFRR